MKKCYMTFLVEHPDYNLVVPFTSPIYVQFAFYRSTNEATLRNLSQMIYILNIYVKLMMSKYTHF